MGRRKKSTTKKVVKKQRRGVATQFKCPFCNHEESVEAKLDYENEVGSLECRVCGATYSSTINYLSEPIDVFSDWIDHCEEEEREANKASEDDAGEDDRRVRQRVS